MNKSCPNCQTDLNKKTPIIKRYKREYSKNTSIFECTMCNSEIVQNPSPHTAKYGLDLARNIFIAFVLTGLFLYFYPLEESNYSFIIVFTPLILLTAMNLITGTKDETPENWPKWKIYQSSNDNQKK